MSLSNKKRDYKKQSHLHAHTFLSKKVMQKNNLRECRYLNFITILTNFTVYFTIVHFTELEHLPAFFPLKR